MEKYFITGATGNIGREVIRYLFKHQAKNSIIAGVRHVEKAKQQFSDYPEIDFVKFDFEDSETFNKALKDDIDIVFLLRPPHIADVNKYFRPLIDQIRLHGINKVVFLSVQGAEKSKVIPHYKIEKLVLESGLKYIFLRPGYFMQNLTTTLNKDIRKRRKIILPAGKAKFNWIDAENIGESAALLLMQFEAYKNKAYEITGNENLNFYTVTDIINTLINDKIVFENVNPFHFYSIKRKEGVPKAMVFVMIFLHFLPRFSKEPALNDFYEKISGKKPTSVSQFIEREKHMFFGDE